MRKVLLLSFLSTMITMVAFSQDKYWSANNENRNAIAKNKAAERLTYPKEFKLFNLNASSLKQELFSVVDRQSKRSTIITLPNADGAFEQFEVFEASNFEPALQAQFPEIRAYSGRGITDKFATVKLSISPGGVQSMVFRTEKDNEFIEPYSKDHIVYSVYKSHRDKGQLPWTCTTEEKQMDANLKTAINNKLAAKGSSNGTIKTLRLAQSCNGEYSNYFGATSSAQVSLVLAAFNATLTRCNGVYEKDLALHLNLIPNTTAVIYYNPATDPYSNNLSAWNNQLQSTLTSVIGEANYDIGHMFGASGGGGNAGCIGCVCVNGQKGRGITSPADGIPEGDNFDIDYVVHEVGHQLGANHTFSMSLEGTGQNKEVGSGITIMGYAGITAQDVAPHSIDIFHETSIAQVQANMANKTCPITTVMTANHAPIVSAVNNYTIPISTPFALTAIATDPENDAITYCWEQNDNSTTSGASSVASPAKATGPNWLSFSPTASGTRTFPRLSTILAGLNVTGPLPGGDAGANIEALSSVSRTLNFRVTVRDNNPYEAGSKIGQTAFTDAVITVTNTSGPFAVTAPNTAVTWGGGTNQTVTWSVNNTTAAPVSCANVNILLSTDGGNTFTTLLANTPNDGSQVVVVPNTVGTTNRIKVEAVGNIFFDISNSNFTISASPGCGDPTGLSSTIPTQTSTTVSWNAVSGSNNYTVEYKAASSGTWITAASATTSTSVNLSGLTASTLYDWRVRANCSSSSSSYVASQFTTATPPPPCGDPTGLSNTTPTQTSITVSWTAVSGANNYDVDYQINAASQWTNAATATTSLSVDLTGLTEGTLYNWRVRANCSGGTGNYVQANFTTATPPPPCGDPTGLTNTTPTQTSTTVSWNAVSGASSYDVDYKAASSGTWTNAATETTSLFVNLNSLSASTVYDWRVRANCTGSSGNFVASQFTTATPPPPCGDPTGLSNTTPTQTSTTVSWAAVSGANDYTVEYKAASSGTWITAASATTSTSVNLSGLTASTLYDWRVRANCSGSSSSYVASQFTTSTPPDTCPGPYDLSANGTTGGAAIIPLNTDIKGTISAKGDNDYYRLDITTGGTITITLTTLPANYDLSLIAGNGTTVLATSATNGNETINENVNSNTSYFIRIYPRNNGAWNVTACYTLRAGGGTATRNLDDITSSNLVPANKTGLKLFPNPAKQILNISLAQVNNKTEIKVYNMMGNLVMRQITTKTNTELNIAKLPAGVYMISASDGVITNNSKFVKE